MAQFLEPCKDKNCPGCIFDLEAIVGCVEDLLEKARKEDIAAIEELSDEDAEFKGWELAFEGCCPGDDLGAAYMKGVEDAVKAIKKLK